MLHLQDHHGADVCLLLFLLWQAEDGRAFDIAAITRIDASIASWRDGVVRPLRAARRALPHNAPMRPRIKAEELAAERLQLSMIEITPGGTPTRDAAHHSLSAYAAFLATDFPPATLSALTPSSV